MLRQNENRVAESFKAMMRSAMGDKSADAIPDTANDDMGDIIVTGDVHHHTQAAPSSPPQVVTPTAPPGGGLLPKLALAGLLGAGAVGVPLGLYELLKPKTPAPTPTVPAPTNTKIENTSGFLLGLEQAPAPKS
jgi:hypothetical protein